jgi:hypothetical protein
MSPPNEELNALSEPGPENGPPPPLPLNAEDQAEELFMAEKDDDRARAEVDGGHKS